MAVPLTDADLRQYILDTIKPNGQQAIIGQQEQDILIGILDMIVRNASDFTDYGVTGAVNSSNTAFQTTYEFVPGTLKLYLNGVRLFRGGGIDYTEGSGKNFSFVTAPVTNDQIIADYKRKLTS